MAIIRHSSRRMSDPILLRCLTKFLYIALNKGIALSHWSNAVNVMQEKDPGNPISTVFVSFTYLRRTIIFFSRSCGARVWLSGPLIWISCTPVNMTLFQGTSQWMWQDGRPYIRPIDANDPTISLTHGSGLESHPIQRLPMEQASSGHLSQPSWQFFPSSTGYEV